MDDPDVFGDISRMHQKQITIHAGDEGLSETGRILYVEPGWTTDDLLQGAGRRLNLASTPKRMFNCNGMEVADVMMIEDREVIFFTQGGDYVAPLLAEGEGGDSGGSSSGLPAVVGAYRVAEFLGKGGFGEVRVGEHQLTGERVALKFLRNSAIADMGAAERTTTEIQCLTALKHPNIIRLVQHINTPQNVVMVFELAEGGDLYQFLCGAPSQRVDEEEGRELFRQIVSGVGHAHNQHICHRDMKLDNVLLSRPGCLKEIKLADFGLSDFYRPGATMRTNCGSISYLAPEVFRGTSNSGPPLDVWSIGVILFALLCGRLPFEGSDLQGTNRPREAAIRRRIMECRYKPVESLSPEAKDLLRRMLKLDPNERASIPEIFNHSWLRYRNVTSLDCQLGRQDERTGLRNVFQDGGSGSGGGNCPRLSAGSRGGGSGSPRLLAPLSTRSGTPPADCKAPDSPRRSAPGSPRRSQMVLDPLEPKPPGVGVGGQQPWPGIGMDVEDTKGVPPDVETVRRGGSEGGADTAECKGFSGYGEGGGREEDRGSDDKAGQATNQSGNDCSSDESHTSRAGQGGLGVDFTITMHPVRGSSLNGSGGCGGGGVHVHGSTHTGGGGGSGGGSVLKKPMIRMNSRLGASHPARKTLSSLSGLGSSNTSINTNSGGAGTVYGAGSHNGTGSSGVGNGGGVRGRGAAVMKSRTIDLSHHFSLSSSPTATATSTAGQGARAASRLLSPPPLDHPSPHPVQHHRSGTIRQRTWSPTGSTTPREDRGDQEETWTKVTPRGTEHSHGDQERRHEGDGSGKGTGSLPPLSPRSAAAEADRHCNGGGQSLKRDSRNERHRASRGSDSSQYPLQNLASRGKTRGCDGSGGGGRDQGHHHYHLHGERKSPRGSLGEVDGDSPRSLSSTSPTASPRGSSARAGSREERSGSWQGWGGSWEGKDQDEEYGHRLLPSTGCSLPADRRKGTHGLRVGDGEDEDADAHGHRCPSSCSRPRQSSSEGFKLPQSPSGRHQEQPQRGKPQGNVDVSVTSSDSSSSRRPGGETLLPGTTTGSGRGRAKRGTNTRVSLRSSTTPSTPAAAAAAETAVSSRVSATPVATAGVCRNSRDREVVRGGNTERWTDGDDTSTAAGRKSSESSCESTEMVTRVSSGGIMDKNSRRQHRTTASTTESDSSSETGSRRSSAAAVAVREGATPTSSSASKARQHSGNVRRGDDDQRKEHAHEEEKPSNRDSRDWGLSEGGRGKGTPRNGLDGENPLGA